MMSIILFWNSIRINYYASHVVRVVQLGQSGAAAALRQELDQPVRGSQRRHLPGRAH